MRFRRNKGAKLLIEYLTEEMSEARRERDQACSERERAWDREAQLEEELAKVRRELAAAKGGWAGASAAAEHARKQCDEALEALEFREPLVQCRGCGCAASADHDLAVKPDGMPLPSGFPRDGFAEECDCCCHESAGWGAQP